MSTPPAAAEDKATKAAGADRWEAAVDRYRDVAKWLVAAFGAIGTVIAGTAPLAGLGSVEPDRLGFVVAGAGTALAGVAVVLAAAVSTLVPQAVYRHELRAQEQGLLSRTFGGLGRFEDLLARHPADVLPPGISSLERLGEANANLRFSATAMAAAAAGLASTDPARADRERAATAMRTALGTNEASLMDLLKVARFEKARTQFNQAVLAVLLGGIAAAVGLGLTLYGIGGEPETSPSPGPARSDPVPVVVSLTPAGTTTLQSRLGPTCTTDEIAALLAAGDRVTGPWDVITLPRDGCSAIRVTLTAELGTVG